MKGIAVTGSILLIVALAATLSGASDTVSLGGEISLIKDQIDSQIERIKRARDEAETKMTLARLRVTEQLRISEENLAIQVEKLNRFEESLRDQIAETVEAMARTRQQRREMMRSIAAEVRSQIRGTNDLISRMRKIREQVGTDDDDGSPQRSLDPVVPCSQTTQPGDCKDTNQPAASDSPPQAVKPAPAPAIQAPPEPPQPRPVAAKPT